jgi:hypothetical protein
MTPQSGDLRREPSTARRRPSTVIRWFDLRLTSNRFVLAGSAAALIGVASFRAARGDEPGTAISAGVEAGLSLFLSWAVARELDPDLPASATMAAVAGLLISFTGKANLGAVTALLFAARLTAGTPGAPPTLLDLAWVTGLAAYTARSPGGFLAGLALAIAVLWEPGPSQRGFRILSAVVAGGLAVGLAILFGTAEPRPVLPTAGQWVVLGLALLSIPWLRIPAPVAVGDLSGEPLSQWRLVRARILLPATGGLGAIWLGGAAVPALVGLWAAVIGIAVFRALRRRTA